MASFQTIKKQQKKNQKRKQLRQFASKVIKKEIRTYK